MQRQSDNIDRDRLFSEWYDTYGTIILRMCYLYLGSRMEAEDAAQDTFVKAWIHMDNFHTHNAKATKAWLMQIAVNTCRDLLRSAAWRRTDKNVQAADILMFRAAPTEDAELLMDVMALPEKLKQVVLLYYYQRMTIEEIASILHVSASTVSRRLSKAEKYLLRYMKNQQNR